MTYGMVLVLVVCSDHTGIYVSLMMRERESS